MRLHLAIFTAAGLWTCAAHGQEQYGAKGIYPIYDVGGQWVIFDKAEKRAAPSALSRGSRFLVIGSKGSELFSVAGSSAAYGGACRNKRPLRLRTAPLRGRREAVGTPIIGIHVPETFKLKGSQALYRTLGNQVTEDTYGALGAALKRAALADIQSGSFRFKIEDNPAPEFLRDPRPESVAMKIDFGSKIDLQGAANPFVLVEGAQVLGSYRRCLRLADSAELVGGCVEMPHALMAETALLQFVTYDPGGKGNPYVLAFTPAEPLWGHERWGFVVRKTGPRLFLMDAMDLRCREGF